ncbi:hypothetical protein RHMOL_Rhmol08G0235200 [Rhododendron molle]|uniref:Uncharacterized protein n=1 Tax=Rhododendron molle TaxID=49168 RepID=A0ACC0MT16_RHOML|nr:hypothetical protein RHMOL_Rhmol08G0235200 [Rhododendron molle]
MCREELRATTPNHSNHRIYWCNDTLFLHYPYLGFISPSLSAKFLGLLSPLKT